MTMRLSTSLLLGGLAAWATAQGALRFTDVSAETGMWSVPTAWGVTAVDLEGDGDVDLLMANNGSENALFVNEGGLRFRGRPIVGGAPGTEALTPGDLNGDGQLDLIACVWGGPSSLFLGNGTGRFVDATEVCRLPLLADGRCGGAAVGDLDGDGDLDLYLPDGGHGDLLLANGGGAFNDVTAQSGLVSVPESECALMADFTDDGRLDVYVPRYDGASALYHNLVEGLHSPGSPVFSAPAQLGACAFDVENDGDLDLLCVAGRFTNEGACLRLLTNLGDGEFVDSTPEAWTAEPANYHTACTGDVDNDGDEDVFATSKQSCVLWLNDGAGRFTRFGDDPGWGLFPGAGALLCDLDGDGDLDVFVRSRQGEDTECSEYLFRNELNDGNWLEVRPVDVEGGRFCHGAQVRVYPAGALGDAARLIARRDLTSLQGWSSYAPFSAHFGLPGDAEYDIEVRFTDGSRGVAARVKGGQAVEVVAR
jgi:hypothetical protein